MWPVDLPALRNVNILMVGSFPSPSHIDKPSNIGGARTGVFNNGISCDRSWR